MKITKNYLKTIIKEELERMQESRILNTKKPQILPPKDEMYQKLKIIANKIMAGTTLEKDEEDLLSEILKTIATKVMNKIDLNDDETKLLGNIMSLSSKITRGIPTTRNEKEIVRKYLEFRSKVKHK